MNLKEAIIYRRSVRTFPDPDFPIKDEQRIQSFLQKMKRNSEISWQIVRDDDKSFANWFVTYGRFHGVRHYIMFYANEENESSLEESGWLGGMLTLYLTSIGYGSCILGGSFDRKVMMKKIPEDQQILYLIAFGKSTNLEEVPIRKRRPLDYFIRGDAPSCATKAAQALRESPTAMNRQEVSLVYHEKQLAIESSEIDRYGWIDLGIAKAMVEAEMEGCVFDKGNHALLLHGEHPCTEVKK